MNEDLKQAQSKVTSHLFEHLSKADGYTKRQIIKALVEKLPAEYVLALEFGYDLYQLDASGAQA